MKACVRALLVPMALALTVALCRGDDAPKSSSPGKAIAIVRTSNLADDLYDGVIEYVRAQYKTRVREGKIDGALPRKSKELVDRLGSHLEKEDVCLLVLVGQRNEAGDQEITILPSIRTVVLETTVLDPGAGETKAGKRRFSLRVQKESLRAIALVLGVPACPFGRCALLRHQSDAQLDVKSRNPCPPCLGEVRERLREAGVTPPVGTRDTGMPPPKPTAPAIRPTEAPQL